MTLIDSDTPLPNFLGKLTTTLQIIYIAVIFLKEIFSFELSLFALDIFLLTITVLSLVVYAYNWIIDLKIYHNE